MNSPFTVSVFIFSVIEMVYKDFRQLHSCIESIMIMVTHHYFWLPSSTLAVSLLNNWSPFQLCMFLCLVSLLYLHSQLLCLCVTDGHITTRRQMHSTHPHRPPLKVSHPLHDISILRGSDRDVCLLMSTQ